MRDVTMAYPSVRWPRRRTPSPIYHTHFLLRFKARPEPIVPNCARSAMGKMKKKQLKTRFDYKLLAASRRLSLSSTFSAACASQSTLGSKPAGPLSA